MATYNIDHSKKLVSFANGKSEHHNCTVPCTMPTFSSSEILIQGILTI